MFNQADAFSFLLFVIFFSALISGEEKKKAEVGVGERRGGGEGAGRLGGS